MGTFALEPLSSFDDIALKELATVGPIDFYLDEQRAGRAGLFAALTSGKRVGSLLVRLEKRPNGDLELVVVAAVAHSDERVLIQGRDLIEHIARQNSVKTIRFQTDRIGLVHVFLKHGADAVITWDVPNG